MSLLKKDNRWVATAFYFTFFPSPLALPLPQTLLLLVVLYSLAFIAFVWGKGRAQTPSSSVLRVRVAFM